MSKARQEADKLRQCKMDQLDELRRRLGEVNENDPQGFINLSMATEPLIKELEYIESFYKLMGWDI
jgi:hypothetical protein